MEYITRVTTVTVLPKGDPLYSLAATNIEIIDEAEGEFMKVTQQEVDEGISITPEEWPALCSAIDDMMEEIKCHKPKTDTESSQND